jgi:hypothetical protein
VTSWFVDDADTKYILKQIKSVYVMASNDEGYSNDSNFPAEIAKNLKKRDFGEMMRVNSDGEKINILVRERGRKKKEFVISVDGDEDVMVYIRTKLDLSELGDLGDLGIKGVNFGEIVKDI